MNKITGVNYIAGESSRKGEDTFRSFYPKEKKDGDIIFFNATDYEINQAAIKAEEFFPVVSKYDDKRIAGFLKTLSEEIISLDDNLIKTCDRETALGEKRLISERDRTCNQLEKFAEYIIDGSYVEAIIDKKDENSQPDIRRMLFPIGPVAIFPASNFPFAFSVCGGDSASAWAARCPVIVKAHPLHPETSELFAHAVYRSIEKNNFPKGFFSLIHGNKKVSEKLVTNPKIKAVGFTGSHIAGRAIYNIAANREVPIPVYAEMGSINPVFITKNAMRKRKKQLAKIFADSITLGSGQFCTKPGLIFINDDRNSDDFIDEITNIIKDKEPGILLDPRIKNSLEKIADKTKKIDKINNKLGGKSIENNISFENTLFVTNSNVFFKEKHLKKEHFGPVSIIVKCKGFIEFLEISDDLEGQLTATIHLEKEDYKDVGPLVSKLSEKVGRIIINGVPTGVRVCFAMQHGGPYPATTYPSTTSVGMQAIKRFLRPVAFQDFPDELLPYQIKDKNKRKIFRILNEKYKNE